MNNANNLSAQFAGAGIQKVKSLDEMLALLEREEGGLQEAKDWYTSFLKQSGATDLLEELKERSGGKFDYSVSIAKDGSNPPEACIYTSVKNGVRVKTGLVVLDESAPLPCALCIIFKARDAKAEPEVGIYEYNSGFGPDDKGHWLITNRIGEFGRGGLGEALEFIVKKAIKLNMLNLGTNPAPAVNKAPAQP